MCTNYNRYVVVRTFVLYSENEQETGGTGGGTRGTGEREVREERGEREVPYTGGVQENDSNVS